MQKTKRKSILIIESPGEERKVIGEFLYALGFEILYADQANDGMRTFSKQAPDLVLVEILLSGINGLSVCKMIKDQESWAKVAVMSKLYQSQTMRKEAKSKWKADAYLEKPFELYELRDIVYRIVGKPPEGHQSLPEDSVLSQEGNQVEASVRPAPVSPEPSATRKDDTPPVQRMPDAKPASRKGPETEATGFATSGVFNPASLARNLRAIAEKKRSGTLKLVAGDLGKLAYFKEGRVLYVKSNLRSESLGQLLLASGTITEEVYRQAMGKMKETGKKLGTVLVGMRAISPDDMTEFIIRQTARKLLGAFSWEGGSYEWEEKTAEEITAPSFPVSVAEVLFSAVEQYFSDWELASRFESDAARLIEVKNSFLAEEASAFLTEEDQQILARVNGQSSAMQVARESGLEQNKALRAFYRLLTAGLVSLGEAVSVPDPPVEEPPEPEPPALNVEPTPAMEEELGLEDIPSLEVEELSPEPGVSLEEEQAASSVTEPPVPPPPSSLDEPFSDLTLEGEEQKEEAVEPDAAPPSPEDLAALERIRKLHESMDQLSDYEILGCQEHDPAKSIRQAFQDLTAMYEAEVLPPAASTKDKRMAASILARLEMAYENIKEERRNRRAARIENKSEDPRDGDVGEDERVDMAQSELLYRDAITLLEEKKYDQAIMNLHEACQLSESESDYFAMYGWAIYRMLKEAPHTLEDAMTLAKKALVLNAGSELAHVVMARMHAGEGNKDAAAKFYKKALSINSQNVDAQKELRELERGIPKSAAEKEKSKHPLFKKLW